ncbi:hypothetical protein FRC10_009280 [Ceratobasidium sp. 414]|nr:hypothetical protein FRC10_009280 [Ceratobasidium sp. 414]
MVVAPPSTSPRAKQKYPEKDKQNEKADSEVVSEPGDKKRKTKRRGEDDGAQQDHEPSKKKQKLEQKDANTDNDVAVDSTDNSRIESSPSTKPKREKRPKKPKDKTAKPSTSTEEVPVSVLDKIHIADIPVPYTNPLTDASLPELSQRGLAYAYQFAQHVSLPSDAARAAQQPWKFNKGRQNWITRNVTDPAVIPDPYLALAMVYIDSIKGGARDALKKTCKATTKEAKAAPESQPEPDQQNPPGETAESENEPTLKKVIFAGGATEAADPTPITKEKRRRAKKILKVLRGKIQPRDV